MTTPPADPTIGHGAIHLIEDNCTSCMICVRECPAWCIELTAHPETDPDSPPGRRARTHNVLDSFTIDWGLCMYCGICVEECPFEALAWAGEHVGDVTDPSRLRHGIADLAPPTR